MTDTGVRVKLIERGADCRIAEVTVDNHKRLNCLPSSLIVALRDAFERLAGDTDLRAVVLTGAGDKAFIGGADLKELGHLDKYEEVIPAKDWATSRDGGPRTRVREDLRLG